MSVVQDNIKSLISYLDTGAKVTFHISDNLSCVISKNDNDCYSQHYEINPAVKPEDYSPIKTLTKQELQEQLKIMLEDKNVIILAPTERTSFHGFLDRLSEDWNNE